MTIPDVIFALCATAGFGPATESASPNQALQHNDHGRHGSCFRTLRASHDRG